MKSFGLLVLILSIGLSIAVGQTIYIPDANLKAGLIQSFDTNSDGEIDTTEALQVSSINLQDTEVIDLTGLGSFTNLLNLTIINSFEADLTGRGVRPLTPISQLSGLLNLDLVNVPVNSVTPLEGLTNLQYLNIGRYIPTDGQVTEISALASLSNLLGVSLDNHGISDICPMSSRTPLQALEFNGNQVNDISCLSALTSLVEFEFSWNPVSDISIIENMPDLYFLNVQGCQIDSISPLVANSGIGAGDYLYVGWNLLDGDDCADIAELQSRGPAELHFNPQWNGNLFCGDPGEAIFFPDENLKTGLLRYYDFNQDGEIGVNEAAEVYDVSLWEDMSVTNLEGLQHFVNASGIYIHNRWDIDLTGFVTDLTPLANLTGLGQLQLINFSIQDLAPIAALTNLGSLHVGTYVPGARITDISVVRNFSHLNHLNIDGHQITDICPVENLLMMQNLPFNGNLVSDISCLEQLTQLDFLEFAGNSVWDISVLENLHNLAHLSVAWNQVSDISPLVANPGINAGDNLYIDGNNLGADDCGDINNLLSRGLGGFVYNPQQGGNVFCGDPGEAIFFPDENLKTGLLRYYDFNQDGEIGVNEAAEVYDVSLWEDMSVTNLEGLQHFVNASGIYIHNRWDIDLTGFVTDLTPLANLTSLGQLQLINFSIDDLSPIENLTNLWALHVGTYVPGARISDISVVQNFPNLGFFNIDNHNAHEICSTAGATSMYQLEFNNNQVTDISCLGGMNLMNELEFFGNPVHDLSALESMTNLHTLFINDCAIDDISPLVNNPGIDSGDYLHIHGNLLSVDDCSDIDDLDGRGLAEFAYNPQQSGFLFCGDPGPTVYIPDPNLKSHLVGNFDLSGDGEIGAFEAAVVDRIHSTQESNVQDLTGLEAFVGLRHLTWENVDYERDTATDLSPLSQLLSLEHIHLMGFGITDVSPVANLTNLNYLFLIGVNNPQFSITEFSSLANLMNLEQLGLDSFPLLNNLSPVTALSNNLRFFLFSYNDRSTDLSPIGQLTNLEILHINNYDMEDFSFLDPLDSLWWLEVSGGNLRDLSPLSDMIDLSILYLNDSKIESLAPLMSNSGLGADDSFYVAWNDLGPDDCADIDELLQRNFSEFVFNPQRSGEICTNSPPVVSTIADQATIEGQLFSLPEVPFIDPDIDDAHEALILWGDGSAEYGIVRQSDGSGVITGTHTFADDGSYEITVTVTDQHSASASVSFNLHVTNSPPIIGEILAPLDPVPLGDEISVVAAFSDSGVFDTHTANWSWGDGSSSVGVISEPPTNGTVSGTHLFGESGVYTLTLTLVDDEGGSASATHQYIVVYDPVGGFANGGGWIESPVGALPADPTAVGKAHFGFQAKYEEGAKVPSGKTQFQFRTADLDFKSTSLQWLVIAGAKAKFKGAGKINGSGDYGFMISAIDGDLPGGGGTDKFRIKIWEAATEEVVYDNQIGESDDSDPTTIVGGGSINIHREK